MMANCSLKFIDLAINAYLLTILGFLIALLLIEASANA